MTNKTNMNPSDFNRSASGRGFDSNDELDALLRQWHQTNAARAGAMRDELLTKLTGGDVSSSRRMLSLDGHAGSPPPDSARPHQRVGRPWWRMDIAAVLRHSRIAAALVILAGLVVLLLPSPSGQSSAAACDVVMAPDAGRLDAFDGEGQLIGPCPLAHTDVTADVSAHVSRVTIQQTYQNRYSAKVEAVYTFPMSHRSAVDRMTMTIKPPGGGERVVVGEVKERELARQIYEAAREQGYVASLLEQERPNIFTQSVANIEPGATVLVEISYVETLASRDGQYTFDFPMVVGPRYIPGSSTASHAQVPQGLQWRRGVVLLGPAEMTITQQGDTAAHGTLQPGKLEGLLVGAQPIAPPANAWWLKANAKAQVVIDDQPRDGQPGPVLWAAFQATYSDGAKELGQLYTDGTGQVNGRWFFCEPASIKDMGTGFEPNTNQVPDASRITPLPVNPARPPHRAGHDISLTVNIDTGGPAILDVKSELHEIKDTAPLLDKRAGNHRSFALKNDGEIPNRDFVLSWRTSADAIQEAALTHTDHRGKFFTLILNPPARVEDAAATPRELVFVMDTSGSMRGFPIEKSKAVVSRAVDSMRAGDTFNVITFSGSTAILWPQPRPATAANKAEAQAFIASQQGHGGTEMMQAINAALVQQPMQILNPQPPLLPPGERALTPAQLADLPADGRMVTIQSTSDQIIAMLQDGAAPSVIELKVRDGLTLRAQITRWTLNAGGFNPQAGQLVTLRGKWVTKDGQRLLRDCEGTLDAPRTGISLAELANFPADGRQVTVNLGFDVWPRLNEQTPTVDVAIRDGLSIKVRREWPNIDGWIGCPVGEAVVAVGRWSTLEGQRVFIGQSARWAFSRPLQPLRLALFFTDGYVGNDMAIVDAVRKNAHTTRVFSFGIGNSVNRYLLDSMAQAGRGEVEYVSLQSDADEAVQRFTRRIQTPVLANIHLAFSDGLQVTDTIPPLDAVPDLFDVKPLIIHGRYTESGRGTLTIRGQTGAGAYERVLPLNLPANEPQHDVIATLWARAKVEQAMNSDLKAAQEQNISPEVKKQIVGLGEQFSILTQYTSFVAVEKSRLTIGGKPMLVAVPIELPAGTDWAGFFGGEAGMLTDRLTNRAALYNNAGLMYALGFSEAERQSLLAPLTADADPATPGVQSALSPSQVSDLDQTTKDFVHDRIQSMSQPQRDAFAAALGSASITSSDGRVAGPVPGVTDGSGQSVHFGNFAEYEAFASALYGQNLRADFDGDSARQIDKVRAEGVEQSLLRIRQLEAETKYTEALQVVDAILVVDPLHPAALALRDVLTQVQEYVRYQRADRRTEYGFEALRTDGNANKDGLLNVNTATTETLHFGVQLQDNRLRDLQYVVGPVGTPIRTTQGFAPIGLPQQPYAANDTGLVNKISDLGITTNGGESLAMQSGTPSNMRNLFKAGPSAGRGGGQPASPGMPGKRSSGAASQPGGRINSLDLNGQINGLDLRRVLSEWTPAPVASAPPPTSSPAPSVPGRPTSGLAGSTGGGDVSGGGGGGPAAAAKPAGGDRREVRDQAPAPIADKKTRSEDYAKVTPATPAEAAEADGKTAIGRAIAAAAASNPAGIPERIDLTRVVGPDRESTIHVDLEAIRNRIEPDQLQAKIREQLSTSWLSSLDDPRYSSCGFLSATEIANRIAEVQQNLSLVQNALTQTMSKLEALAPASDESLTRQLTELGDQRQTLVELTDALNNELENAKRRDRGGVVGAISDVTERLAAARWNLSTVQSELVQTAGKLEAMAPASDETLSRRLKELEDQRQALLEFLNRLQEEYEEAQRLVLSGVAALDPALHERGVQRAVTLLNDGHRDEAVEVAEYFALASPAIETGAKLRDLLKDESLSDADRKARIEALAAESRARLEVIVREQTAQDAAMTISDAEAQAMSGAALGAGADDLPLLGQHIVLVIDRRVQAGELDKARRLAAWLTQVQPNFAPGTTIHQALIDEKLNDEQKRAAVGEQAARARAQLGEIVRVARLHHVLEPQLLAVVQRQASRSGKPPVDAMAVDQSLGQNEPVLVTVLVNAVDRGTRQALTKAGLTIEDSSPSPPLIVGRVSAGDLEKLALVDVVRRIEPTKMQ